ncbi:MAG: rhomboid family intramembrane serine protease, partial [Ignavibacteriae bacterium]|nr:rhomboid family intramembrane serine protease [Ignavibacteriota bacterium]
AFGMLFPNRPIYLYFLLPIRAKFFITGFIILELFYGVTGSATGVAHFAHLGGAAVGFVYTLAITDTLPLRDWWSRTFGSVRNPFEGTTRPFGRDQEIHDAKFYDIKTGRPVDDGDEVTQEVIDAILDKISTGGYQSLTDEERRILNEASRKIH